MTSSQSISTALNYFKDRRLITIFFFGVASGFPWILIGSAMSSWLQEEGFSRSSIGLFGLIFVAYSINFLWSPLVDRIKLTVLTNKFGQRRSWILLTQSILIILTYQLSQTSMQQDLSAIALLGFLIALAGATQDIAIDAYRIDLLQDKDSNYMASGSAMATSGWWTGYAGIGAIPFYLVDQAGLSWQQAYLLLALVLLVLSINTLFAKEPATNRSQIQLSIQQQYLHNISQVGASKLLFPILVACIIGLILYANLGYPNWPTSFTLLSPLASISLIISLVLVLLVVLLGKLNTLASSNNTSPLQMTDNHKALNKTLAWLLTTMVAPIQEFFSRNGFKLAVSLLLFIFLFKLGEAYLGRMSIVFYKELGFSNSDIATYSKLINWGVTILFSLIGSVFTIRFGIFKGLFIGGIAMSASNLLFALMAMVGPNKALFAFTVIIDGFTSAWGSVAFVALLSVLCNKSFSASQYALMASLGTLGRTMLGSYSGVVVDWLDGNWAIFFVITSIMVIPSLLFLYLIKDSINQMIAANEQQNAQENKI
ncbi:AmpG family muropeptide MFS transporter [Catenovulum sp. SX2]|uniref:AmpG family muropeptide MFS transporter n=1 Tax=Catenovulum sp. SX2 TaxID=3398614 RepID=UPI003F830F75